jgi:MYXO-CTERM domain-containing protein
MKLTTALTAALIAMASNASAALYVVSNVGSGYGYSDALIQLEDNSLSSGGIVALGYFSSAPSASLEDIATTISNFTVLATGLTGTYSASLGGTFAGYVESETQGAIISEASAEYNKSLYMFVGNAATLAGSTQWGLVQVAPVLFSDDPVENTYVAQPYGLTPVIGTIGSYTGDASGFGSDTFTTLKLVSAVPEPTAALLGSLGALGLLRRRRNA